MTTSRLRRLASWILVTIMLGVTTQIDAQRAVFRSSVAMVPLTVTVTDAHGKYVNSLASRDFTIFEDGVEQSLGFFASEHVAVDLGLVLDVSASMHRNMPLVQKAARGLIRMLRPRDRASVAALRNVVGMSQPLTDDRARIDAAIQGLTAEGGTALYDGLYVVLKELGRVRRGSSEIRKQTIVLLSDGLDTMSRLGFRDVQELAARVGVNIYVVAVPGTSLRVPRNQQEGEMLQADYAMRSLARDSGGRAFFPKSVHELPALYEEIGTELANQYELGYQPLRPVGDRSFRRVSVRVENAIARTRSGYYADPGAFASIAEADMRLPSIIDSRSR
jgi:Ca-activated chloride channel family protein